MNFKKAIDYCENVFDGTHETPKYVDVGYKFLTSKNIMDGYLDKENAFLISQEDYDSFNIRSQVHKWDVLFSMIGSVGNVCLIQDDNIDFAVKNMGVFSCRNEYKAKWLYYYFKSPYAKKLITNQLHGAVQKFLGLEKLREFPILEYSDDKKPIVDLLSNIDDKIALNNKTNTELENMAKTIYDYWFTQFDFPDKNGHPYKTSGGQMVYNETFKREIPAGWEVKRLGDVCEIVLGGTPSTDKDEYWNGNIPWLNSGEVAEFPIINAEKTVTELGIKDSATELVPSGTVTLSITRHLRPSILTMDACINQSVVGIKENEIFSKNFLYPFIASKINHYMKLRTGAQQPHINKETVDDTLVCIPSAEVLENYNKEVGSIYERIILNAKETKELTVLRDYLLPLLMNGQIEVK